MNTPLISVILPVHNCEMYVGFSIKSILKQNFKDFELIVIDDGSNDGTLTFMESFRDKRIKLIKNEINLGNYKSRNIGLKEAKGKYICVMDADDISAPNRLQLQSNFLEKNEKVGICGSQINIIPNGTCPKLILESQHLKVAYLSNNFCVHPSIMFKSELLSKFSFSYNEKFIYSSDFDFCSKAFNYYEVVNLQNVLLKYRIHSNQISNLKKEEQKKYANEIRINQLINNLNFKQEEIPINLHLKLMTGVAIMANEFEQLDNWIQFIKEKNKNILYYDENILNNTLDLWRYRCINVVKD